MAKAIILRLESYLTYLNQLHDEGNSTTTSQELAKLFGISSSRVRQDLVALGTIGKPRSGYDINALKAMINEALDVDTPKKICLIGCGNLGRALAGSDLWKSGGFELRAIFDKDPKVIETEVGDLKVRNITELFGAIKSEEIQSACLTVPAASAQQVADLLVAAGIQGIWNFSTIEIYAPVDVVVENQRLEQGLMTLSYRMKRIGKSYGGR